MMIKNFVTLSWSALVIVFFVIIAGSVVRATGSGMGCPDWPKCFGYLIPPGDETKLQFQSDFFYKKDQMILYKNQLLKAKKDFTSGLDLNRKNWEVYEKHSYAIYNPVHTWIEYINRLLGVLSGLFVLILFGWAVLLFFKKRVSFLIPVLSFCTLIALGFQAWLGKIVVDSNLEGAKITAHLFGALLIVALLLLVIHYSSLRPVVTVRPSSKPFIWISLIFLLLQIFLGTEFRVLVDEHLSKGAFQQLFNSISFKAHRSFAWVVLISTILFLWKAKQNRQWQPAFIIVIFLLLAEITIGILLYYLKIPTALQPLHLLFACLLFAFYFQLAIARSKEPF